MERAGIPLLLVGVAGLLGLLRGNALAQTPPRTGSVRVLVRDAQSLVIAGAQVTISGAGITARQALTNESGAAEFESIPPGRYAVTIESPGFDRATLADVVVRSGSRTGRDVELRIAGLAEEVDVTPRAMDRQLTDAFARTLSADEIADLPEDPDELALMLARLAGGDADFRIDGFADDVLPPGTQIESIRIVYDGASAGGGAGPHVEIRTRPGGDRWRSHASFRLRDGALNARNAFSPERPHGQTRQYSWSVNGPVVKNQTGLSFTLERTNAHDQETLHAATPSGLFSALNLLPSERIVVSSRLDQVLTAAQRLRVDFRHGSDHASNLGLGELDLPERAFARENSDGHLRVGHSTTVHRMVHDLRVQLRWRNNNIDPISRAPAVRVSGAFSSGGAQQQGGRHVREIEVEDELMFTVRRHQVTVGVNAAGTHFSGDEWRNAGGTFTFASLDDYMAGRPPTTFTQRTGNPAFSYALYRFGAFAQENFRVRPSLMLHFGVREEFQTHLADRVNLAPRVGVDWTPAPRLKTTLRGSYTVSFQPFQGSTYEQTLLVNGERQRDIQVAAPSYPDPFADGVAAALPPGIIRTAPELMMPSTRRLFVGVDQPVGGDMRLRANYSRQTGHHLFRGVDVNAPDADGVRPDMSVRTITELRSSARSLNQALELNAAFNYRPKRVAVNVTYTLGQQKNETDGPLTLPPDSHVLAQEWGPSRADVRHRFDASINTDLWLGFRIGANARAQSAPPYTLTTGIDSNGDGVANERPPGVGRNSERGVGSKNVDMTLTWEVGAGRRQAPLRPRTGSAASGPVRPVPLVRFELYAQATNVLNTVNLQSFNGVQTSPFGIGQATAAAAARRIAIGARMFF
jgi:hypothetical protein